MLFIVISSFLFFSFLESIVVHEVAGRSAGFYGFGGEIPHKIVDLEFSDRGRSFIIKINYKLRRLVEEEVP